MAPALAVLMVVSPLTTLVAGNLTYAPSPGVGWYLWWLLLFDVVYVSFQTTPPVDEALAVGDKKAVELLRLREALASGVLQPFDCASLGIKLGSSCSAVAYSHRNSLQIADS